MKKAILFLSVLFFSMSVCSQTTLNGDYTITGNLTLGLGSQNGNTGEGKKLYFLGKWDNTDHLWMCRYNVTQSIATELRVNLGDNAGATKMVFGRSPSSVWTPSTVITNDGKIGIGGLTPGAALDIMDKTINTTKAYLARLPEGSNTSLSVKAYNTQPAYCKSFAIEHIHANTVNGAINFNRGGSQVGGTISFSIDGSEKGKFSYRGLDVQGIIQAKEVKVALTGWADYVFAEGYNLSPLSEVKKHIEENKHLPGIPTEKEVVEEGVNIGEMQVLMLQKIEELTLYTIQQQELIDELRSEVEELKQNK